PQLVAQWKLKRFKPHVVRVVAYLKAQVLKTKMRRTVLPALTAKVVLMDIAKHTHAMQRVSAYLRWRMRRTRYRRLVLHSLEFQTARAKILLASMPSLKLAMDAFMQVVKRRLVRWRLQHVLVEMVSKAKWKEHWSSVTKEEKSQLANDMFEMFAIDVDDE
ncbi:hypothetical protein As57867_019412, partial [Aphanomyces stellatus]